MHNIICKTEDNIRLIKCIKMLNIRWKNCMRLNPLTIINTNNLHNSKLLFTFAPSKQLKQF